jgi:glycosyltransferase involved in cell wall biosynthesis
MGRAQLGRTVVLNDRSEAVGGASGLALLSAQMLAMRGVPVTFIAGDDGDLTQLRDHQIEHVALGGRALNAESDPSAALNALWNRRIADKLARWVAEYDQPDTVYHLHGWQKVLSPAVFAALSQVRRRLVVHAHDFFLACPNGAFMNYPSQTVCSRKPLSLACLTSQCDRRGAHHKLYRLARHYIQNSAAALHESDAQVLLIHEAMREPLVRSGLRSANLHTLINPCVPFLEVPVRAERNQTFFFIGRLQEEKGAADLAAAARTAGVPLEIIGDGPERASLTANYPEIRFHGWQSRPDIAKAVQRARCIVMPSRYQEPFGLVAVESLQSGIPVIVPEHALLAPQIRALGLGLAVDTRNRAQLASALSRIGSDDLLVRQMSSHAASLSHQLATTPEQWCNGLLDHYERMRARPTMCSRVEGFGTL